MSRSRELARQIKLNVMALAPPATGRNRFKRLTSARAENAVATNHPTREAPKRRTRRNAYEGIVSCRAPAISPKSPATVIKRKSKSLETFQRKESPACDLHQPWRRTAPVIRTGKLLPRLSDPYSCNTQHIKHQAGQRVGDALRSGAGARRDSFAFSKPLTRSQRSRELLYKALLIETL